MYFIYWLEKVLIDLLIKEMEYILKCLKINKVLKVVKDLFLC